MDFAQRWRRWTRGPGRGPRDEAPSVESVTPQTTAPGALGSQGENRFGPVKIAAAVVLAIVLLYYPLGAILDHRINDDLGFAPQSVPPGGSQSVAMAAALIDREVRVTGWVANTPPIASNALLKYGGNMMNFQMGIVQAVSVYTLELKDRISRTRGLSADDPDLVAAESNIREDPERWIFGWGRLLPGDTAEDRYKRARDALRSYNGRLAEGDAVFDRRVDNLLAALDRIALDLGQSAEKLRDQVREGRRAFPLDRRADKIYYNVKGRAYAYALILRALRDDFTEVVEAREVGGLFDDMLESLEEIAAAQPTVVMNGRPDGMSANNHLASQGFQLIYARTKLREITEVLEK